MKVLYFHQYFSTPNGSTGTRSYEFAKRLIKRGHEVTIICGSYWIADTGLKGSFRYGYRSGKVDDINVIELKLFYSNSQNFVSRSYTFFRYSLMGIYFAMIKDYDLLFATSTPLTASVPGIFARIFRKKPFIFEVRDLWPELPKKMGVIKNPIILFFLELLERASYKVAVACIGLSPGIVKGIKKKEPLKRVKMIPNGCDNNLTTKGNYIKRKNVFKAVFAGAHGHANGLIELIKVAELLTSKDINDIEIELIGDGIRKPELIQYVKDKKIKNCNFLDPMSKKELFMYLNKNADLGLMILKNIPAFYYGTSPNKFFDYISIGLPVLINYPGWISNIIIENKCGIYTPPENPSFFLQNHI